MDKQRRAKLQRRLDELEDRLPAGGLLQDFSRKVGESAAKAARGSTTDTALRAMDELSKKLDRSRADFMSSNAESRAQLDALNDGFAQMHESVVSQISGLESRAEATRTEMQSLVDGTRANIEAMSKADLRAVSARIAELASSVQDRQAASDEAAKHVTRTAAEMSDRLDRHVSEFLKYRKLSDAAGSSRDARASTSEEAVKSLASGMESLRAELLSKMASLGGGSPNQEVRVAGSVMSSKYADMNFQNGGGIRFTAADDNTGKRVNITASIIVGTGGGSGTPGGNNMEVQFNDGGSFGGASVMTWNKNTSVLAVTNTVRVDTDDGPVEITNFGNASTDAGVRMTGGENIRSALFTEVNGSILSLGINVDQIGNRDTTKPGWIFRLDDRVSDPTIGDADNFVIKNVPPSGAETNRFVVQGSGSVLSNGPILPLTNGVAALGNDARGWSRMVLAGAGSQSLRIQAASTAGNWTMVLPGNDGSAGQYLLTDGSGITQWASVTAAGGSGITRVTSIITANTTAGSAASTDYVLFANAGMTVTLPTAVGNNNLYTVKVMANTSVLVAAAAGQDIDGAATATLPGQYTAVDLRSNGSVWGVT